MAGSDPLSAAGHARECVHGHIYRQLCVVDCQASVERKA